MPNEVEQRMCTCGKPADCPIAEAMCQDCWEKHCDKAWWKEVEAVEVEQRLREIEERVRKATPGPWYAHNPDDDMSMNVFLVATTPEEPDPWWDGEEEAKKVVAITMLQSPRVADVADGRWEENAGFIAHAREDVPWLLSLLREREEENRRLREALAAIRDVRRYGRTRFGHPGEGEGTIDEVADEIGDVLFLLARIANLYGIALGEAAQKVLDKIKGRVEGG